MSFLKEVLGGVVGVFGCEGGRLGAVLGGDLVGVFSVLGVVRSRCLVSAGR